MLICDYQYPVLTGNSGVLFLALNACIEGWVLNTDVALPEQNWRTMIYKLTSIACICTLLVICFSFNKKADAPVVEKPYDIEVVKVIKKDYTRYDVYNLAMYYADSYGIPYNHMLLTIDGESDFQQYAKGDGGKSLGACQIHSSNKIPTEKRNDPRYCLEWTAQKMSSGQARMWTAYRTCVLGETVIDKNGKRILCHATGTL